MSLPTSVTGDGRTFVSALNKVLTTVNDTMDGMQTSIDTLSGNSTVDIGQVSNLNIEESWVDIGSGQTRNDLTVTFNSDTVTNYKSAKIYAKHTEDSMTKLPDNWGASDVSADSITSDWVLIGTTTNNSFVINNVLEESIWIVKVIGLDNYSAESTFANAPSLTYYVTGKKYYSSTPSGLGVSFDGGVCHWHWNKCEDYDLDFYEIREDENPGYEDLLVDRPRHEYSDKVPRKRAGILYLYNRNRSGKYSMSPCPLEYIKPVPSMPTGVIVKEGFQCLIISCDPIPDNCTGIAVTINGERFFSQNNSYTYNSLSGNYIITVAYTDIFGDGIKSDEIQYTMISQVTSTLIEDNAITTGKLSANAVTAVKISANTITGDKLVADTITGRELAVDSVTAENIKAGTITADELATNSVTADKISANSVGTNKLVASAITSDKIAAGAITATKIDLSSTTTSVSAGAVRLDGSGMKVMESSGAYTKYDANGITWFSSSGVTQAAIKRIATGIVPSGKYIRLNWLNAPIVMVGAQEIYTAYNQYTNTKIRCYASEVSSSGFRVNLQTVVPGTDTVKWWDTHNYLEQGAWVDTSWSTPGNTTSLRVDIVFDHNNSISGGIELYVSKNGGASWIDAGAAVTWGPGGATGVSSSITVPATILNGSGSFMIKLAAINSEGSELLQDVRAYYSYGETIINQSGNVIFIALETNNNSTFTIED